MEKGAPTGSHPLTDYSLALVLPQTTGVDEEEGLLPPPPVWGQNGPLPRS